MYSFTIICPIMPKIRSKLVNQVYPSEILLNAIYLSHGVGKPTSARTYLSSAFCWAPALLLVLGMTRIGMIRHRCITDGRQKNRCRRPSQLACGECQRQWKRDNDGVSFGDCSAVASKFGFQCYVPRSLPGTNSHNVYGDLAASQEHYFQENERKSSQ